MKDHYAPRFRPASCFTLPAGVAWEYVEAPARFDVGVNRPDLPRSTHPHGVIATDRPLTVEEREHFDLQIVG
jgi:hypothetical protein